MNPAGKFDIFLNNAKNTNPEDPTQVTASAVSQTASMATVTVTEDCSTSTTPSPTESMGSGYGTSTAVSAGATQTVIVGGPAGLVYTPEFVNAAVGDVVKFDFRALNHTVTQSSLNLPCMALPGGEKSGFRPNPANTPGVQIFEFTVPNEKPQWFYCGQANHCEMGEFLRWIFCVASQRLTCLQEWFSPLTPPASSTYSSSTLSTPNSTVPEWATPLPAAA